MKNVLLQAAMKLNKGRKKRKWWQVTVRVMATVVVFCTTYALILPAITMEGTPACGLEAHAHLEDCYTLQPVYEFQCALEQPAEVGHSHEALCYNSLGELICPLPEINDHTHESGCYDAQVLQICTLPEDEAHTHEDVCYDFEAIQICEQPEIIFHVHTESCRVEVGQQPVLTCQLPEHTHEEACYPAKEEDEAGKDYLCGSGEHAHVESCYDAEGILSCTIPEHSHEAACLVKDLDLTADVETRQQWEQTLKDVALTGNWPGDVLAVAESQLGYTESTRNMLLESGRLMGYTRYGAWYGLPYGDWCTMYAAFCLHYAGVEDYPVECEVNDWIEALDKEDLYLTSDVYAPKPGDLIFYDFDQKKDPVEPIPVEADHVGIVAELIPATEEEPAKLKAIEGNTGNRVAYVTYELDDPAIIGYGFVPTGEQIVLTYQGADYTVRVSFAENALIPDTAVLSVEEILRGTEEYENYYRKSVEAMLQSATVGTEEELAVSFARFFDISFLVDGLEIEPAAAVDVQIVYNDGIRQAEAESGVAVHFANEGIEVLDAQTCQSAEEENENIDTFNFKQDSFSVVGTVLSAYERAIATTATRVEPYNIDNTGNTLYVLYTQIGNRYYALDGNGKAVPVTVSGNTVTLGADASDNLFWSFVAGNGDYVYSSVGNLGTGRYLHPYNNGGNNTGTTTGNPYDVSLVVNGSTFRIRGANNNYLRFQDANSTSVASTDANRANSFYVAQAAQYYNVWFDGTDGGMMSYYGAANENRPVVANAEGIATVTLPETWQSSTKYPYKLQGWYDINSHTYYPVDPDDDKIVTATINGSTVFYADWIAATYDVGVDNEHVVSSVDTNDFITTHVFDYNALFNVMSQNHEGTISAAGHNETWSMVNNGKVAYNDANTLGFSFVDYDANGEFSYANGRDNTNVNQGDAITAGILTEVYNVSGGKDLLKLLFDPNTEVIGKYYAGTGNYLFQYMDSTTENYDGVHDGYYYLDARLNAASYNQTLERFYLYDYLERTSDSDKDGGVGQYSDFLPFNSPYIFGQDDDYTGNNNQRVDYYEDSIRRAGWEYDAKDGGNNHPEYNELTDATTNYFFGIRTDIEFFLPNDAGSTDEYGNYGNISTRGEHMIFDFHGDDDVWVFIDGELVLDIGGLHGVMFGQVDFSSGTVITGKDGGTTTTRTFTQILGHNITEGTHTMTVYYMERGSSQSNCAIYFNIAPRYDLEITKEDIVTAEKLDNAVFAIFTCEACANTCMDCYSGSCDDHDTPIPVCEHIIEEKAPRLAQLWDSRETHEEDMKDGVADHAKSSFTVVNGVAKCWGISAGKTYYIREITPPPGYPESDDLIRITLNNRGAATIETTTLHGSNGIATEGFAVIKQNVNDTLKIVALTVTNQPERETTEVRVVKTWAEGSADLPQSVTVLLMADGKLIGRQGVLTAENGWSYTWKGLPKYAEQGIDREVVYEVLEVLVPDYITTQGEMRKVEQHIDWIQVAQMSDSKTYLLVHNGQALSYDGSRFGWVTPEAAKLDTGRAAQWDVTTDHDGFHLKNGLGYTLTFNPNNKTFYGTSSDAVELNQVVYYLNSRLVIHDHDVYYQFGGINGSSVSEDGLAFTLYQKDVLTGFLTDIVNTPVEEENQTYVEVNKVWEDGNENHARESVTIRLYADDQYTGRSVVLSDANGWKGGFYDLPYTQTDGKTVIHYTVEEDAITGYLPRYSDGQQLPGLPVTIWQQATSFTANSIYSFTSGSYALAVAADNSVVCVDSDLNNNNHLWKAVNRNGTIVLQNVGTNLYLVASGSSLSTTNNRASATGASIANGYVRLGQRYLELGAGYAQTTATTSNIANQRVSVQVETAGAPGTGYTVTNVPAGTELPNTGGLGAKAHIFGGLLFLAAALIYVTYFGRKRQKGGV